MPRNLNRRHRNLLLGLAFLSPNILGFLAFTLIPLGFSMALAFSNWDITLHNMFKDESIKFVGFDNFIRLLTQPRFYQFLSNTLFLMMATPFAIAGSLVMALLLSKDLRGRSSQVWASLIAGAFFLGGLTMLLAVGAGHTAMVVLVCGLASMILVTGVLGGTTVYRTLVYLPSFTSGVAVFILWKKLYNPHTGPVNSLLAEPLESLTAVVRSHPGIGGGMWLCLSAATVLVILGLWQLRRMYVAGELGWLAGIVTMLLLLLPVFMTLRWSPSDTAKYALSIPVAVALFAQAYSCFRVGRSGCAACTGLGSALMLAAALMTATFIFVGLSLVFHRLGGWAAAPEGLIPPEWLTDYYWAKPAIMIMGLWTAIGSNNMLLYLAGLSNIPQELYEAAEVDGASRLGKFWHIAWPQLAPTTFFIVVMSVIGGLQGGFEVARTMTKGGPAGATTTLSYFIYTEGFETGRLGYSSAVAWTLFILVFTTTMFNWKFGSRYVND